MTKKTAPALEVARIETFDDYQRHAQLLAPEYARRLDCERSLLPSIEAPFFIPAYCCVCEADRSMRVDYTYAFRSGGRVDPNWREWLRCETCGFNNRLRAALHILAEECQPHHAAIYATEQTTDLYRHLRGKYDRVTGSEFLGTSLPHGFTTAEGVRNETLTALTFADDSFDVMLSFDVLEHIPDYPRAIAEMARVLRAGGRLLLSVPFLIDRVDTLVRARMNADGTITHFAEPEYHGDPLSADGILCFHHFGWDLLDGLRSSGFAETAALLYWSAELGYLGTEQVLFLARKR
jgi:SAM-dependent methyltransferase